MISPAATALVRSSLAHSVSPATTEKKSLQTVIFVPPEINQSLIPVHSSQWSYQCFLQVANHRSNLSWWPSQGGSLSCYRKYLKKDSILANQSQSVLQHEVAWAQVLILLTSSQFQLIRFVNLFIWLIVFCMNTNWCCNILSCSLQLKISHSIFCNLLPECNGPYKTNPAMPIKMKLIRKESRLLTLNLHYFLYLPNLSLCLLSAILTTMIIISHN